MIRRDGDLYQDPSKHPLPKDYKPSEPYVSYQERNGLLPPEMMERIKIRREISKYGYYFSDNYSMFVDENN